MYSADKKFSGTDPEFPKGGGGGPWDCKIGHAYKMSELEHTVKTIFAPEILALPQGRDYNELPVQKSFSVILITIFLSWV